jgi:hypothetical protein
LIVAGILVLGFTCARRLLRTPKQFELSDEVHPAEGDPLRDQLLSVIQSSAPFPDSDGTGLMLAEALKNYDSVEGVTVNPVSCYATACMAEVDYPSKSAFNKFDDVKIQNPHSAFRSWRYSAGRTGLLSQGARLFATWYFFRPQPAGGGYDTVPGRGVIR